MSHTPPVPTEDLKATHKAVIHAEIERFRAEADDGLKRWVTALTVGNGAGLFGVFGLAAKPDGLSVLYLLLPSAWLFVFGILSGSVAALLLVGGHRQTENHWRAEERLRLAKMTGTTDLSQIQDKIAKTDKLGDDLYLWGGASALASGVFFIVGVALPLFALTARAMAGQL